MRTIRRLIYGEALRATGFVTLAFLALFSFFDLVDTLGDLSHSPVKGSAQVGYALLMVALQMPNHLYQLLPITALIGSIYVMARLAESSEFTILRTSGLGPGRALVTLLLLGAAFVALTFVFGDYVAPGADRATQSLKARLLGDITTGRTGAWLKDRQGALNYAVNVGALSSGGDMSHVTITEMDTASGRISASIQSERARFADGGWLLQNVERRQFEPPGAPDARVRIERLPEWRWATDLTRDMVSAALLSPDRMQTLDLFQYIRHLQSNGQSAQRYEIEFWRKVFYPLSCLVMMVLALPFAYLHFRTGNIAGYVFLGVLVGISFFLLNNVFGHIGNLRDWVPWMAAAAPGVLYSIVSLAAFGWLVLRR